MPPSTGKKRERDVDTTTSPSLLLDDDNSPVSPDLEGGGAGGNASTTNFRNVSACNRCRNRKNRCDQKLPKCSNCAKANVRCVGFDPVSKREIPRSYVYYLETRVNNLEAILSANNISFPPPSDDFAISETIKPGINVPFPIQEDDEEESPPKPVKREKPADERSVLDPALKARDENERLNKLVDDVGMVSVRSAAADPRSLGSTSGISFARVVFAAVKSSVHQPSTPSEKGGPKSFKSPSGEAAGGAPTMRDSFFGLHSKPTIKPAPFPERELGSRLAELYFEHANPQIPVLHRCEFTTLFDRVYATEAKKRTARELYMLNIVFAIGSGIIMDSSNIEQTVSATESSKDRPRPSSNKRQRLSSHQQQPEEYHAAAIIHLESFLGTTPSSESVSGGLEELQAVLLLASLALLRPVAPGLWYIIGVAVRLSIDLGLHFEDIDHDLDTRATHPDTGEPASSGLGRKQWTRDLRRRLWWCVFNLDRLVSACVGRPVSINEAVVTAEFPSLLDDQYITPSGFLKPPHTEEVPSYKLVTRHYLRLRLLQSEILQVLQHRQADQARQMGAHQQNSFVLSDLESPFLRRFRSFREWRAHIDMRLADWKETSPQPFQTGVAFNPLFLELNYWQAVIMLYRQSLSVPEPLANELSPATGDDVQSPGAVDLENEEDKQMVFLKVAQAGQTVLKIYRQLHRLKLVNYTFLATHHLFMSGISFLYAIWHSTLVRSQLTIDDVDFTVLAATSVLSDLSETCPPAEACRDAFVRMSKATISMVMGTTGFGNASTLGMQRLNNSSPPEGYFGNSNNGQTRAPAPAAQQLAEHNQRPMPKFDLNLKDLFSEEEIASRPMTHRHHQPSNRAQMSAYRNSRQQQPEPLPAPAMSPVSPQSADGGAQQQYPSRPRMSSTASVGSAVAIPYQQQQQQQPSYQQQQPSFTDTTISHAPQDFTFGDHFDFLNDFSSANADPNAFWGGSGQQNPHQSNNLGGGPPQPADFSFDLVGFGNNGFDSSGAWEANGELFDSFFFGTNNSGGGGGNGY